MFNKKGKTGVNETVKSANTYLQCKKDKIQLYKSEKIFLIATIIMAIIGLVSILIKQLSIVSFICFGAWSLYFLGLLIYETQKKCNVSIKRKGIALVAISSIIIIAFYAFVVYTRQYIYTLDNGCYYIKQLNLLDKFNAGFLEGIKEIVKTTYAQDYGSFLLVFTSLIFNFTNKTGDAFVITYVVVTVIPALLLYYMIMIKLVEKCGLKNNNWIYILGLMLIIAFPLLHYAAISGQPDFIGLIFVELIILLTMDYDFSKIDIRRCILIIITTFCLIITRRWYIYWVASYYLCYAIILFASALISKDKEKLKTVTMNLLKFAIISFVILGFVLSPMIYKIVKSNFNSSYSAWNLGGMSKELSSQLARVGAVYFAIMFIGIIYGIKNKSLRMSTIILLGTGVLATVLFTRLQNMGPHHSIIIIPTYIYMFLLCIIGFAQIDKKVIRVLLQGIIVACFAAAIFGTVTENKYLFSNIIFSRVSLKPAHREDFQTLAEMDKFILENCDKDHRAYINAATIMYCANTFENYMLPDRTIQDIIPYEASINSVHGFPTDVFKTKYMFISNIPLEATGAQKGTIIQKLKESVTKDDGMKDRWKLVREFKMTDKVTFYAYERVVEFDEQEAEFYIKKFEEESKQYPNLFKNRIENYVKDIYLKQKQ